MAIEGGDIQAGGMLGELVIVSDDARQVAYGRHAFCWVHNERLVHQRDTFTDVQRVVQQLMRALISRPYDDRRALRPIVRRIKHLLMFILNRGPP